MQALEPGAVSPRVSCGGAPLRISARGDGDGNDRAVPVADADQDSSQRTWPVMLQAQEGFARPTGWRRRMVGFGDNGAWPGRNPVEPVGNGVFCGTHCVQSASWGSGEPARSLFGGRVTAQADYDRFRVLQDDLIAVVRGLSSVASTWGSRTVRAVSTT